LSYTFLVPLNLGEIIAGVVELVERDAEPPDVILDAELKASSPRALVPL